MTPSHTIAASNTEESDCPLHLRITAMDLKYPTTRDRAMFLEPSWCGTSLPDTDEPTLLVPAVNLVMRRNGEAINVPSWRKLSKLLPLGMTQIRKRRNDGERMEVREFVVKGAVVTWGEDSVG